MAQVYSFKSILIMAIFATCLIVLPLILPEPLPPPPFAFLFFPVAILGFLLMLALSPAFQLPNVVADTGV